MLFIYLHGVRKFLLYYSILSLIKVSTQGPSLNSIIRNCTFSFPLKKFFLICFSSNGYFVLLGTELGFEQVRQAVNQ